MLIKLRTNQDIQQVLKEADADMYNKKLLESKIASSSNDLSHIADAILSHHEHWDGNGYPTLAFYHLLDGTPLEDIGHHKVLSLNTPCVSVTPN